MPTGYQITDQQGFYFLTFQVIDWVDIFTRQVYRDIIIDSLKYCRKAKGLRVWAYVIMSNHVHTILSCEGGNLSDVIRDFKRHTATTILKTIENSKIESRRDWILQRFEIAASRQKRNSQYQFWTHKNHAIILISEKFVRQKMGYIHRNPVKAGWVVHAHDWLYSSERNYQGMEAVMEIDLMDI